MSKNKHKQSVPHFQSLLKEVGGQKDAVRVLQKRGYTVKEVGCPCFYGGYCGGGTAFQLSLDGQEIVFDEVGAQLEPDPEAESWDEALLAAFKQAYAQSPIHPKSELNRLAISPEGELEPAKLEALLAAFKRLPLWAYPVLESTHGPNATLHEAEGLYFWLEPQVEPLPEIG